MSCEVPPHDGRTHWTPTQLFDPSTFAPLLARTQTIHNSVGPVAYDCVKVIFVRAGSAILLSEFGERPVSVGDVVLLGANTLCGSNPEGSITVTTIYCPLAAESRAYPFHHVK